MTEIWDMLKGLLFMLCVGTAVAALPWMLMCRISERATECILEKVVRLANRHPILWVSVVIAWYSLFAMIYHYAF